MNKKTKHKHAALIHAWANGEIIEFKSGSKWNITGNPCWAEDGEYRIKPEVIRYRTGLYKNGNYYYVFSEIENNGGSGGGNGVFIKWLTDWIEVEV
ncbi:MAG: hypothetical protein PHR19_02400 [Bacteroidales bacterium]|nr:hypothetical protein [Bacteroidales bacterium]